MRNKIQEKLNAYMLNVKVELVKEQKGKYIVVFEYNNKLETLLTSSIDESEIAKDIIMCINYN